MLFRALQLNSKLTDHLSNDSNLNEGITYPVFTGRQSAKNKPVVRNPKMMLFSFELITGSTSVEHRTNDLKVYLPERGQKPPR